MLSILVHALISALVLLTVAPVTKFKAAFDNLTSYERASDNALALRQQQGLVLADETSNPDFTFNVSVPANFSDTVTFLKPIIAPNINNGVTSFQSTTGAITLVAGSGVSISGLTIANSDAGSAQDIFKNIAVSGQTTLSAGSNSDTLTFAGGIGLTVTTDSTNKKVILTPDFTTSGWTRDSGNGFVYLTNSSDKVGIGTSSPTYNLQVAGTGFYSGSLTIGTGSKILPANDLGADLGAVGTRFNNLYVANINSNSSQSFSGQTTFSYAPTDATLSQASVLINPTTSAANGLLLDFAVAGFSKAAIDAEGDLTVGYASAASPPASTSPFTVYNHGSSQIAYIDANGSFNLLPTVSSGTGTSAGFYLAANSLTSGNGLDIQTNSITSGNLLKLASTSTTGNGETGLNIAISGANGTSSVTNYGFQSAVTNTGTSSTNIAGYFSASGGSNNYGLIVNAGNVGIGTTTPGINLSFGQSAATLGIENETTANTAGGALTLQTGAGLGTTSTAVGGAFSLVSGAGGTITSGNNTAGAGGALSFTAGAGGTWTNAGSATNAGGNGGAITLTAGNGGTATGGSGGTRNGGAGGAITLTAGNSAAGPAGALTGGAITLTAGGGVSTSANGGSITLIAGNIPGQIISGATLTLTGGSGIGGGGIGAPGGNVTLASGVGQLGGQPLGASGNITIQTVAGTSGNVTAPTNIGGASGTVTLQTLAGGAGYNANGGASGTLTISTGTGGAVSNSTGTGGAAGAISVTGGNGGGTNAVTGGVGSAISLTAGNGGAGSTTGGIGGNLSFTAGNAGTGGNANGGTITLTAGTKTGTGTPGNISFVSSVTTGTGTSGAFVFNDTSLTTGALTYLTSSSITTGKLLDITDSGNVWTGNGTTNGLINFASSSTAAAASASNILLNLSRSGANTNSSVTSYGLYSNVTNTGTTSTNVGGYFSASGASTNYGLIVNAGNVGIGTTTPGLQLSFGQSAATLGIENETTANTAGGALTIQSGAGLGTSSTLAGGALSLISGAGGNSATTAITAGAGGTISFTGGIGGTASTGNATGGSGGAITLTGGQAGLGVGNQANGSGGGITITGGGAAAGGSGSNAFGGGSININGGGTAGASIADGGSVNITAGAGTSNRFGGSITLTSGSGQTAGSITFVTANTQSSGAGGAGTIQFTQANFGQGGNIATGHNAGAFAFTGGTGETAAAATSTGGNGSAMTITLGAGGVASGNTSGTGGNGGSYTLTAGAGGNATGAGTVTGGTGGSLNFTAGNAGTGGNANGGALYFIGGTATGTGTIGNVLLGINSSGTARGNVGIGTITPGNILDVLGSSTATASAMIRNTSSSAGIAGLAIKLSSSTLDTTSRFINFLDLNGTIIGKIQAANTTSVNYAANGTDFAEWFSKDNSSESFVPGDVVVAGNTKQSVAHTLTPYDSRVVGIISTHPAFTGGVEGVDRVVVALTGQVPINIDPLSPSINPGDPLTSSARSGLATKAIGPGFIVGKAQETWTRGSGVSQIMAFVNVSWYNPVVAPTTLVAPQISQALDFTIIKTLTAQGGLIVGGPATFNAETVFNKLVTFIGDTIFNGKVTFKQIPTFSNDTAGTATIKTGTKSIDVKFSQLYEYSPVVTATLTSPIKLDYVSVTHVAPDGFTIEVSPTLNQDITINWIAIAVKPTPTPIATATPSASPSTSPSQSPIPLSTPASPSATLTGTIAPSPTVTP